MQIERGVHLFIAVKRVANDDGVLLVAPVSLSFSFDVQEWQCDGTSSLESVGFTPGGSKLLKS